MINLRYHIVSITAVFLALGIGLTLGSTFLDRVTVDTLKAQLDDVEAQVEQTEQESGALRALVDDLQSRNDALQEALPERLLDDRLEDVPVLVVATEGSPPELLDEAIGALSAAGADVAGTWRLTERWALDDDDEVEELQRLLDVATDDPDRLRRNAAIRLAEVLDVASQPPPGEEPIDGAGGEAGEAGTPQDTTTSTEPGAEGPDDVPGGPGGVAPPPSEPELVAALEGSGFIQYDTLDGATDDDGVLLPGADVRYVVISSTTDLDGPQTFAASLIDELSAERPVRLLAAQGEVDLREDGERAPEGARRTTFVGLLRDGELTRERVSTLDHLDTAAGLAALVLAVEDLAEPIIGHYGVGPAASRLLPGAAPEP